MSTGNARPEYTPEPPSQPFKVGQTYTTREGFLVEIVSESKLKGYECVEGDDGIWRYNRASDRGRCTGSAFDMSDPRNLVPAPAEVTDG